jgi:hypothetical protein
MGQQGLTMPKVQEAVEALSEQRRQHTIILAELEGAERELREAGAEVQNLRARVAEKEADLARSGAPLSDAPFGEDIQIAQAERRQRVLALRADIPRGKAQESQERLKWLKGEIETAWLTLGRERHRQAQLSFEQAAISLRERWIDLAVFATVFRSLSLAVPEVVIGNVSGQGAAFINCLDPMWCLLNQPEASELYASLRAARAEVEQAKAG